MWKFFKRASLNSKPVKMERIYLKDLLEELRYRDLRSVYKWCTYNQVRVLFYPGSNPRFVIKEEFEKALTRITQKTQKKIIKRKRVNQGKYTPQGETEKAFLSSLQIDFDRP